MSGRTTSKCVGIVKEVYNKWERRAPLTPTHVRELVKAGVQVIVQPSNSRIFTNEQYALVGAQISNDLSPANVILGVKQVPINELLAEKTYMFFSHTIKAQPENMELLDAILQKKIMLIDYECITHGGDRNGRRLIAFGGNAGRAGMIAGFRGIGERLISKGYSTPFVNIGSAYSYSDLERAKEAVEHAGNKIKVDGIPNDLAPMTFVFTGNGNVSKGAQEIFRLMPHQMVHPSELPHLPKDNKVLYGTIVQNDFMVKPKDPGHNMTREDYYANPHLYEPVFHDKVAPFSSMIVNCMYWDDRFPRLLTRNQLEQIYISQQTNPKLIGIADISCDIEGSMEFLEYATDIERPFALYDPVKKTMKEDLDGDGIMIMSVDILPSELPCESSQHFGDKLIEFMKILAQVDAKIPLKDQDLPKELKGACIANNGILGPNFEYIHRMRAERERNRSQQFVQAQAEVTGSTCLRLEGHLFDSGLINQVLNLIEEQEGAFYLVDCQVRPNFLNAESTSTSSAIVQVSMKTREELDEIIEKVKALAQLTPGAEASVTELPDYCGINYSKTLKRKESTGHAETGNTVNVFVESKEKQKIICFGAGLVAAPLVEYLSREPRNEIHVISSLKEEAHQLSRKISRQNVKPNMINVIKETKKIEQICADADCVVSLLPATMHINIAKICIQHKTPLVTASYISPEMKELDAKAKSAGIPILCELGLDPGMDHMSAMKVIAEVKAQDGKVMSFSSVCGGLPAPEVADNPIGYKFSWSPRGVLLAALNSAQYRKNGKIIHIAGEDLLRSQERVNFLPAFALEQIPNRNSLPYAEIYGIPEAHTIFRGTLRYAGCCNILYQLRQLGLFDTDPSASIPSTWPELLTQLHKKNSKVTLKQDANDFLKWLGIYNADTKLHASGSVLDTFCGLLQEKLTYQPGERDIAIMHHEFGIEYANGKKEKRTSTYVGYGGTEPGDTIMAKTVGVTAAIGVQMILQDIVQSKGVLTPTTPDIYVPGLARLEVEGIHFNEKTFSINV